MPIAAIIALVETYGPIVWSLAMKYGPTVVSLAKQYGPAIEAQIGPLISASVANGTLEQDIGALISNIQILAPQLGSLANLAEMLAPAAPVDIGNPTPAQDVSARPDKRGGR